MHNQAQDTVTAGDGKVVGPEGISWRQLPAAALLAALAVAGINATIFFVASGFGFIPENLPVPTPRGEQPLTLVPVVIASAVGANGAAVVFATIGMFSRRPVKLFHIVATVVLVLSFAQPLTIPGVPLAMILSLEAMHVAAWAVTVGLLTTMACLMKPANA